MQVARELSPERYASALAVPGRAGDAFRPESWVEPRELHRRRHALPPMLALWLGGAVLWCAVVGVGVVTVQYHAEAARRSARLGQLEAEAARIEQENQDLRAAVSELSSMQRIEREARRLGLVKPQELRVVAVDPGVVAPEPPAVAQAPPAESETGASGGGIWERLRRVARSVRVAQVPPGAVSGQ